MDLLPTELSGKPLEGMVNQKWFKMVRVVNFILFFNLLIYYFLPNCGMVGMLGP